MANRLFVQRLIRTNSKENIIAPHRLPFVQKINVGQWIPCSKGPFMRKVFPCGYHILTDSPTLHNRSDRDRIAEETVTRHLGTNHSSHDTTWRKVKTAPNFQPPLFSESCSVQPSMGRSSHLWIQWVVDAAGHDIL